jgi:glycosyltransferase involved in cell wall biosynthesis
MTGIASVILPAHDEAACIGACLEALLASDPLPPGWQLEVIVVANGCRDDTAAIAGGFTGAAAALGWDMRVIDDPEGGKLRALNRGDAVARGAIRIYLDADVAIDPGLLAALVTALDMAAPRLAGGRPRVAPATSPVTRAYARFWQKLAYFNDPVPGFGVFAMNAAGRARWGDWPDIISDDTFARLSFAPRERIGVAEGYVWPMVEGFANLVRVRRRQDAGVAEIAARFPERLVNAGAGGGALRQAWRDPLGFAAYAAVALAVRTPLFSGGGRWARGR